MEERSQPISHHLGELRRRLIVSCAALVIGCMAALYFASDIYTWLTQPLLKALPHPSQFIALSPLEGWLVYFKVALVASLFCTSPVWLYQAWAFMAPGLRKRDRASLIIAGFFSAALFCGGALVCYYLVIPHGFAYLVSLLEGTNVTLVPQMKLSLAFMLRLLIAFGIAFEVPVVTVLLAKFGIAPVAAMKRARPYVIVGAFVFAAIITPPDVITQVALAIPFIILFEISLLVARFAGK